MEKRDKIVSVSAATSKAALEAAAVLKKLMSGPLTFTDPGPCKVQWDYFRGFFDWKLSRKVLSAVEP